MIKLLTTILLLLGCSNFHYVEKDFKPYVNKFKTLYKKDIYVTVKYGNTLAKTAVALCYHVSNRIIISRTHWNKMSEVEREFTIFHELGHCVQHRGHKKALMPDYCPVSLMYPSVMIEYCMVRHYDHYIEELFN